MKPPSKSFQKEITTLSLSDLIHLKMKAYAKTSCEDFGTNLFHCVIQEVEKALITFALEHCEDNKVRASNLLGIGRNTLKRKIVSCQDTQNPQPSHRMPASENLYMTSLKDGLGTPNAPKQRYGTSPDGRIAKKNL